MEHATQANSTKNDWANRLGFKRNIQCSKLLLMNGKFKWKAVVECTYNIATYISQNGWHFISDRLSEKVSSITLTKNKWFLKKFTHQSLKHYYMGTMNNVMHKRMQNLNFLSDWKLCLAIYLYQFVDDEDKQFLGISERWKCVCNFFFFATKQSIHTT